MMSGISRWLSEPAVDRLGLALLHFVWEGLLVALLVWAVVHGLRVARGRGRYAVYLVGMLVMAGMPVVNLVLVTPPVRARSVPLSVTEPGRLKEELNVTRAAPPRPMEVSVAERARMEVMRSLPWVSVIWLVGVVVLSGKLLGAFGYTLWIRRSAEALPAELRERAAEVARRVGFVGFDRVYQSARISGPMALGLIRPMVLLPAAAVSGMPAAMLEAVIAHELAHIRRLDLWVNLMQRVIETLLFYHPAVWWISRRIREEREICCDEAAVAATGSAAEYAAMLEQFARARGAVLATSMSARGSLLARVRHLLNRSVERRPVARGLAAGVVLATLASVVALGAISGRKSNAATTQPAATQQASTQPATATDHDKARVAWQNRLLERSQLLNNLKQRYAFRLQELRRDLREQAVKLSIDGMGTPGRLSAKEVELGDRLKGQFETQRRISELKSSLEHLRKQLEQGAHDPDIVREVERDPRVANYVQQVDDADLRLAEMSTGSALADDMKKLQKRRETLEKKLTDRRAELLANLHTAKVDSLEKELTSAQNYAKELQGSVDSIKQDLGDLTYAMSQYLTVKDEEQTTRDLLGQVTRQLDQISEISTAYDLYSEDPDVLRRSDPLLSGPGKDQKR